MGNTFNDIKWQSLTYSSGLDKYIAGFNITVIKSLPVEYLRTASQEPTDNSAIDSIAFPDVNQMNLYISKNALPVMDNSSTFHLKMQMDDRRDFTNCVHPDGPDKYEINMTFTVNNNNDIMNINNISWNESVVKGAI